MLMVKFLSIGMVKSPQNLSIFAQMYVFQGNLYKFSCPVLSPLPMLDLNVYVTCKLSIIVL